MLTQTALMEAKSEIVRRGNKASPREIGGLICPDGTLFFLPNEATQDNEFRVSSAQFTEAVYGQEGVESLGFNLPEVVVWHTHPSGLLGPSRTDIREKKKLEQKLEFTMWHLVFSLPGGLHTYY